METTQFTHSELQFRTVAQVRKAFKDEGSHWFDAATMRAFGTTIPKGGPVFDGRFFVSKESSRIEFTLNLYMVREVVQRDRPAIGRTLDITTHAKDGFRTFGEARAYILGLIASQGGAA